MPLFLSVPANFSCSVEAHKHWLELVQEAERLVEEDKKLQAAASRNIYLKARSLAPEVVGRHYALYCDLLNKMYDAYLNSVHMQRAAYMLEIIGVLVKRMYELRNELVHIIVNDYIYVDRACAQLKITPFDIQIVVPYHMPLECRPDSLEQTLRTMWAAAVRRKNKPPPKPKKAKAETEGDPDREPSVEEESKESSIVCASVHTILNEDFIKTNLLQRMERYRQYFIRAFYLACSERRLYYAKNIIEASTEMKNKASIVIERFHREFMRLKRKKIQDIKRDVILGILPRSFEDRIYFDEANFKMYERRRRTRHKIEDPYKRETLRENERLIFCRKDGTIEDITEDIREWFKDWYYGYGYFPEYPYEVDGGTLLVMTGQYKTIEEKELDDEVYLKSIKGKTKDQLKKEKEDAIQDALFKKEQAIEKAKMEAEKRLKQRCDPFADPGYKVQTTATAGDIVEVLRKYRMAWNIFDVIPPERFGETVYGYIKSVITEDIMNKMHVDCRFYVDQLMRLEVKVLIKAQLQMFKRLDWKFKKTRPRPRPKVIPIPKPFVVDDAMYKTFESVFDLGIVSKPTNKIKEIYGDQSYVAYDYNIRDPEASFPLPGYGDVRRRLVLSCVFGAGIEPNAVKNKAVLLVGAPQNGKSFLVDCVVGEMNAVKIDISPEVLSSKVKSVARILGRVFNLAKVFQPTVIYCRDIERVFAKKVLPADKKLRARSMKTPLTKILKTISPQDKVIFIATCSNPLTAKQRPMARLFNEIILVPRTDYGTLMLFFQQKFNTIRSLPREQCTLVQPLAQLLQGYGFGFVMRLYDDVMNDERIVRLNVKRLSLAEFIQPLIENDPIIEPITKEGYAVYSNFCLTYGPVNKERQEYTYINSVRKEVYKKAAIREAKRAAQKEKA